MPILLIMRDWQVKLRQKFRNILMIPFTKAVYTSNVMIEIKTFILHSVYYTL